MHLEQIREIRQLDKTMRDLRKELSEHAVRLNVVDEIQEEFYRMDGIFSKLYWNENFELLKETYQKETITLVFAIAMIER